MWKLIKMDFYRLFTSRTVKIGAIVAFLVCAGYMLLSLGAVELGKYALVNDPASIEDMAFVLSQIGWVYGIDFADIVLSGTSAFALFIGCMITASFIGSEQSAGFTKNYAGRLNDRGYIAISKFVVTSAAQLMVLLIYSIASSLLAVLMFGNCITGYNVSALIGGLFLRLMLHLAINSIIVFICMLTKSHGVAMVMGCIFGIGVTRIAYMAITALLGAIKINFPIADFMPDGVNYQISASTVGDLAVRAIIVSIVFCAAFVAANYMLMRKRDVR